MCWQDVQIRQQQFVQSTSGEVVTGTTLTFGADERRARVVFGATTPGDLVTPSQANVRIFAGNAAIANRHIFTTDLTVPFSFDQATFGTCVNQPFIAVFADNASLATFSAAEIILVDPQNFGAPNQSTPRG